MSKRHFTRLLAVKKLAFNLLVFLFRFQNRIVSSRLWIGIRINFRRAYWKSRLAQMGYRTGIFPSVVIHNPALVSIGEECSIAEFVHIWGGGGVEIGDRVLVASHVSITSMSHEPEAKIFALTAVRKPVVIEDNVWIGTGAVILSGVRLGTGCIVGAGAVVTNDVPANWIVVGVPARRVRLRENPSD
ncbi:acyltransferase [Aurantimonas sp. A2-1-M11]|uniref:acyltransferase n=1 Tax=Aurantimonas sp. A2-1-M11 TaxID=3113712 RepID=UPI002F9227B6